MTAVGSRNRKKAILKIQKKVEFNTVCNPNLKILVFLTDFCKNPKPIQKFDGLPSLII